MALTRKGNTTTTTSKPSLMSRLKTRQSPRTTTTQTKHSTNPITGKHTTTTVKKEVDSPHTHGRHTTTGTTGVRHNTTGTRHNARTTGTTGRTSAGTHHRRKPSMGDKVSGAMMKVKGSLTKKPGLKAAGTRRMHGTDGKGAHYAAAY